jgi:ferredoxin
MKKYKVKVQHDKGKSTISLWAMNEESAKQIIMAMEGCPEGSILSVKENPNAILDIKL